MDLGTGDGRLPYLLARNAPERLFIGVDANAAALRELSGRAARSGQANLLYVRAAVEDLPPELTGLADRVTVILPWGSLLAAVAGPAVPLLRGIAGLGQPGAVLTVVLGLDPIRDGAELARLGLPALDASHLQGTLRSGYAAAGLDLTSVRPLTGGQLSRWRSTWSKRLAYGPVRPVFEIQARVTTGSGAVE